DIILFSRLSDARASASGAFPPPRTQTDFLPAHLGNSAIYCWGHPPGCSTEASSTSNSSIFTNNPIEGLRVVGDGTASALYCCGAFASAKLIVLSFTLTEVPYPYSISGQLNGASAKATLTDETGTIFE